MRWTLTVVTDGHLRPDRSHLDICRAALAGGAGIIQLRDKALPDAELLRIAKEMKAETDKAGALLVVNDRVSVAASVGAAIHLGRTDTPVVDARRLMPAGTLIGATATTVEEARAAAATGADYIGVSPIFDARGTKPDAGEPAGLGLVREIRASVDLPLVGIGGITPDNADAVIAAGADGVAVVSAVVCADDMVRATARLLDGALRGGGRP